MASNTQENKKSETEDWEKERTGGLLAQLEDHKWRVVNETEEEKLENVEKKRKCEEMEEFEEKEYNRLLEKAKNIVAIMDIDSHMINKKFVPKEIAIKTLGDKCPLPVFFFHEEHQYKELDEKDKRTCNYILHNIYDVPIWKWWYGMLKPCAIEKVLRLVCKYEYTVNPMAQYRDAKPWVIAFKGRYFEKDLLEKMDVPYINLEDLGCPKVGQIVPKRRYGNCGMHRSQGILNKHCPTMEVQLFEQCLKDFMIRKNLPLINEKICMTNPYEYLTKEDYATPPALSYM